MEASPVGSAVRLAPAASQVANDLAHALVVEEHWHSAWTDEDSQPVPHGECVREIDLVAGSANRHDRERLERRPVPERPDRLGESLLIHGISCSRTTSLLNKPTALRRHAKVSVGLQSDG